MAPGDDEEARIDAELKETEKSIEELQRRRTDLLRTKAAIRRARRTTTATPQQVHQRLPSPGAAASPAPTKNLERALNSLEWSSFKKREGEWAFLRNRDGSLVDALASETDFVNQLRRGRELVVGKYRYVVSEDKFLNRYFEA